VLPVLLKVIPLIDLAASSWIVSLPLTADWLKTTSSVDTDDAGAVPDVPPEAALLQFPPLDHRPVVVVFHQKVAAWVGGVAEKVTSARANPRQTFVDKNVLDSFWQAEVIIDKTRKAPIGEQTAPQQQFMLTHKPGIAIVQKYNARNAVVPFFPENSDGWRLGRKRHLSGGSVGG
jgi:hypothetical protein